MGIPSVVKQENEEPVFDEGDLYPHFFFDRRMGLGTGTAKLHKNKQKEGRNKKRGKISDLGQPIITTCPQRRRVGVSVPLEYLTAGREGESTIREI